jgi:glycosyltransferase involved in cell wall biosynthesis
MKIAVLNNCVPFLRGGAEHLAEGLRAKLVEYGHDAFLARIPFCWEPPEKILEHMLACRSMRLPGVERAIALKFPAYYLPHPQKIVWLLHQFRQAYDLWGTPLQGLVDSHEGRTIRDIIIKADNSYLSEASKIFSNSKITADRLKQFNNLEATVLLPPLLTQDHFGCGDYGDYIFCPGRINRAKRQRLLVESVQYCKTDVRLLLAGSAEELDDAEAIEVLIRRHGLEQKVQFVNRFISEEEKAAWFSESLGCAYIPFDEDSYGYVTLESYLSKKPVITCSDSGGIGLLVKDGVTGCVVTPDAKKLAQAMDSLYMDKSNARRLGEAGYELVRSLDISWDRVIRSLTT